MLGGAENGADLGAPGGNQGATSAAVIDKPTGGEAVRTLYKSPNSSCRRPRPVIYRLSRQSAHVRSEENPATPALPIETRDTDDDKPDQSHGLMFGAADCNARDNGFSSAQMPADGAGGWPLD
jgi:hypothetical protein